MTATELVQSVIGLSVGVVLAAGIGYLNAVLMHHHDTGEWRWW